MYFETATEQLDDLLHRVCVKLQLAPSLHEQASQRYQTIANWLGDDESPIGKLNLEIYPQGSLGIGTTVRPQATQEFDLDFVCEVDMAGWFERNPTALLDAVEKRLKAHATYAKMLSRKPRCVRLQYANEFHMDILPGCRTSTGTKILVPDSKRGEWVCSNPRGYKSWFRNRGRGTLKLDANIEPLGGFETAAMKNPLQRTVQLVKRWRDIHYGEDLESAPISIVLTTLTGHGYGDQHSTSQALKRTLEFVRSEIQKVKSGDRLIVRNPTNANEDLSERWETNRDAYAAFCDGIHEFHDRWTQVLRKPQLQAVEDLSELFGEKVTHDSLREQTRLVEDARSNRSLRVSKSGLIGGAASGHVIVPKNTFFGSGE